MTLLLKSLLPALLLVGLSPGVVHADQAATRPSVDATASFALLIGSNQSPKSSVPNLRYADDDAARFYELFSRLGQARLLTVLDDESQPTFRDLAGTSQVPSKANLRRALDELFAAIQVARAAGQRTAFYFVYSGHGDVGPGLEGFLALGNDRLTRGELFREVIARSPADYNHVVIDACNAYFMVKQRGAYADDEAPAGFSEQVAGFLAAGDLRSYPNTGVVVSTSAQAESHEWGLFGGGVFSHQVRSGLLGSADLDLDGRVSYDELAAYLAAANSKVSNPRAKINYYLDAPPKDRREPIALVQATAAGDPIGRLLQLDSDASGRFYLEDGRGQRYLDFNKAGDGPLRVLLLAGQRYYLRGADFEVELPDTGSALVELSALSRRPLDQARIGSRGAVDDALRSGLYAVPFTRSFFDGYTEQAEKTRLTVAAGRGLDARAAAATTALTAPRDVGWPRHVLPIAGWSALGLGAASALVAAVVVKLALDDTSAFDAAATLDDKLALRDAIAQKNLAMTALFAGAGVLGAGGIGLLAAGALVDDPASADAPTTR